MVVADVLTVLQEVSKNPSGRFPAWRMVRQHWAQISRQFGQGSFTIGSIIKAVTSTFTSAFDLGEVSVWCFKEQVSFCSGVLVIMSLGMVRYAKNQVCPKLCVTI
ncbi:Endoplasmic reticulum aminopeptidase 2 [Portunus trituberculatus]|uniref:Endoplasmic reticulum aminopeptidase 2 n=1 Tax=Portunus trituberculatus TaxID=210409 RepID=A0A5B7GRS3_PORTR|nr:Endoplasmic reticulum aminopeptidase 2 [Portunus trituberculatus]